MSSDSDLDELFNELRIAHGSDLDAIKEVLKNHGIDDPSKTLMKKLLANVESKRCCSCHFVAADLDELKVHLKKKGHKYGQGNFANDKREFIYRVKKRLGDKTLPDVNISSNSPKLTNQEKRAFSGFDKDSHLTTAERLTYENLLYIGLCMEFISKSLAVTPSKKTEAVAKKAVIAHKSRQITPYRELDV